MIIDVAKITDTTRELVSLQKEASAIYKKSTNTITIMDNNEPKEKGVLDLYMAAHDAASKTLEMTSEGEIQAFAMSQFKAAGFSFRHDYNKFYTYLGDERIKLVKLSKEVLPSKMNQATV